MVLIFAGTNFRESRELLLISRNQIAAKCRFFWYFIEISVKQRNLQKKSVLIRENKYREMHLFSTRENKYPRKSLPLR